MNIIDLSFKKIDIETIKSLPDNEYIIITKDGENIGAIINYQELQKLKHYEEILHYKGLANIAENWENSDEFAQELDKIVQERYEEEIN